MIIKYTIMIYLSIYMPMCYNFVQRGERMKEELFDDLILERGFEYAQEGACDHVRKAGNIIYATVHGTSDYHVKLDGEKMFCDCPYAAQGAHCKHMAALLYHLEDHPIYDENVIIDHLSEKEAKTLLKKIIKDHPEYLDELPRPKENKVIEEDYEKAFKTHPDLNSARHYIELCIRDHEDIEILIQTFKPYLEDKKVFSSLIEYYSKLDLSKAIYFVEHIQTDKPWIKNMYDLYLKDLYLKANDREKYLNLLWRLTQKEGQINLYKELKRQYTYKEWQPLKEKLIASLPSYARLDKIYKEEKMYDDLLELVINTPGLYILEEYKDVLKDYPEQLLNKYLVELKPLIGKQDITQYLNEIREIPNGEDFIKINHLQ